MILGALTGHLKTLLAQNSETVRYSNDTDVQLFSDSIKDVFKSELSSGNSDFLYNLFNGEEKSEHSPIVIELCDTITSSLSAKGMNAEAAKELSFKALPRLFNAYNSQIIEAKNKGIDIPELLKDILSDKFNFLNMGKLLSLSKMLRNIKN